MPGVQNLSNIKSSLFQVLLTDTHPETKPYMSPAFLCMPEGTQNI